SAADYAARLRRRSDDHAELAELLARRAADRIPAQREQTDLAAADLDLADRRWTAGAASSAATRGVPERADLVARRTVDRVHRVEGSAVDAREGSRRQR